MGGVRGEEGSAVIGTDLEFEALIVATPALPFGLRSRSPALAFFRQAPDGRKSYLGLNGICVDLQIRNLDLPYRFGFPLGQTDGVNFLVGLGVQAFGFCGSKAQFQKQIRVCVGDVADFGVDFHLLDFIEFGRRTLTESRRHDIKKRIKRFHIRKHRRQRFAVAFQFHRACLHQVR